MIFIGIIVSFLAMPVFGVDDLVVNTENGKVRGVIENDIEGGHFFAFKGIPYGAPPVGELRFKDPLPAEPWTYVRNATEYGSSCLQVNSNSKAIFGSEDCLYVNVYTKSMKPDARLPVMVWIHGGAFLEGDGSNSFHGPDYLLRKDIVLVTLNYRLSILGFLNLDVDLATGNQGLKDQVLALQWVRSNIGHFGGDPKQVTIFGESAGSASVHLLTLSPLTKGLFHKAICQSGVALNPWSSPAGNSTDSVLAISAMLGNESKEPRAVVEFLKSVDSKRLFEAQKALFSELSMQCLIPFVPTVDNTSKNPFMPIDPREAAKKGVQVPLLIGFNDREGLLFYTSIIENLKKFNTSFEQCLHPITLQRLKEYNLTPDELKRLYLRTDIVTDKHLEKLVDLVGDMLFVEGIHETVKIQIEKSSAPTYVYRYTYDNELSAMKKKVNTTMSGASHADDVLHLFRSYLLEQQSLTQPLKKGTISYKVMQQMTEMWVNFATTGKPTVEKTDMVPFYWQPANSGTVLRHMNINQHLHLDVTLSLTEIYSYH